MVNPEIVETSGEWTFEEGCLSVPERFWEISRPSFARVVGFDLEGNAIEYSGDELMGAEHPSVPFIQGIGPRGLERFPLLAGLSEADQRVLSERLEWLDVPPRSVLFREGERYDLHPIVRQYAYDRLADRSGVHGRLREYFEARPAPERGEDGTQEGVEDVPDEPGVVGHAEAQRERKREHPLPDRYRGQHAVDQVRGRIGHAATAA